MRKHIEERNERIVKTILSSTLYYNNSELKDLIKVLEAVVKILKGNIKEGGGKK